MVQKEAKRKAKHLKDKAKERYDQNAPMLSDIKLGDKVFVQDPHKKWDLEAQVIADNPKRPGWSYKLRIQSGRLTW